MDLFFIVRRFRLFLALALLLALALGSQAPFVETVNNVDYFRLEEHPDQKFYEQFQEVFGNDEFFVVAFSKPDIFTPDNLELLRNLSQELEDLGLARDVLSLANADNIIGKQDAFYVQPFLDDIPQGKKELKRIKRQATGNPLYANNLISKDGSTAAIVVFAQNRPEVPEYRQKLLQQTRNILADYQQETKFYLAGWTVTNYSLSQYMQKDLATFIPLTYLLITLVTFAFFRNLRLTLLTVLTISAAVGSTMGLFRLLDIPINNVTTAVPPLVMALTLTAIVHIFTHMQRSVLVSYPDRGQALAHVLRQVAVPCALTTLTTTTGFLSLSVSELEPIRQFSLLAAAGMVFGFIYSFFLLPPLILLFEPSKLYVQIKDNQKLTRFLKGLSTLVGAHKHKIVILNVLLIAGAAFFAVQIKVETNLIEFFKKSSQERQSIDFVEERLSGVGRLDISVQGAKRDAFIEPQNLRVLEDLESFISKQPGVDKVNSFNHFLKDMHMSFHDEDQDYYQIPDNRQLIAQYLLLYDSDDIDDFMNSEYDHARLGIRLGAHGSKDKAQLIADIQNYIESLDAPNLDIRVTGQSVQDVNVIETLVSGQIYSLSIALASISLLMFLVFKSLSLGFLSLIPNCFPIVINFGVMGLLDIPLNTATSLIAAMAIGIAVDDTIHFLFHYNSQRKQGIPVGEAVQSSMLVKGRALLSSSLILSIGFSVLLLSSFIPMIHFGGLSALIIVTALVGDMVFLAAILNLKNNQRVSCGI